MSTVTYPTEWEEIKKLAKKSDYKAIMDYANYKEEGSERADSDNDPTLTHEFSVQSFAISALAKFPTDEVTQFLIQKFNDYQDDYQKSDVLESISQHETNTATCFLIETLKEENSIFTEAVINGLDGTEVSVSREILQFLINSVSKNEELLEFIGAVFEIAARSDEQTATELLDKEFEIISTTGALSENQGILLEHLVDAATEMEYRVDLPILERLLKNDGNDWNAGLVARLVSTYPDSQSRQQFLVRLQEDYAESDGVMSEINM